MALRCSSTRNLEIHHVTRTGGNQLNNAQVLCHDCHVNTQTYGVPGNSPAPFTQDTKDAALRRAGNRCECTRDRCH